MAEDEIIEGIIMRSRNLITYKGMTDDEIRAKLVEKRERDKLVPKTENKTYDAKFKDKLTTLQNEFAVDMNDANDREMLSSLVRHMLQSESADEAIRAIYDRGTLNRMDFLNLKNLGEYQGTVDRTVAELSNNLGISRKLRKEKQTDDIPQWVASTKVRVKSFFDRHTIKVECPKCQIELWRYWENFKQVTIGEGNNKRIVKNIISATLICWKCHETIIYNK